MKIILKHCESYDPERIKAIVLEGMDTLCVQPKGRTLVKPNLVMPHKKYFAGSFTRSEFMDGLLAALRARGGEIEDLAVGERSGLTIPSRYAFVNAGYRPVLKRHGARAEFFDERPSVPVPLRHPQALHDKVYISKAVTNCDFLVNAPKYKMHAWLKVTFALKNFIGLQDDAHRLIDHNFNLARKIVDLQEVISSGFIVVDGIQAGEYSEIAPQNFPLNLIIMGVNPVAVDTVCTHIAGLDPYDVEYIRLAAARGYGSIDLDQIEIGGDVSLTEAQQRAKDIRKTLVPVDQFLDGRGNLTVYLGKPPERNYCMGGCPGVLLETVQILEVFQPEVLKEMKPISFLLGDYRGELKLRPGEKLVVLGDCACWSGRLNGLRVKIANRYTPHLNWDRAISRSTNALLKLSGTMLAILRQRGRPAIEIRGCPALITEVITTISLLGDTVNPNLQPDIAPLFTYYLLLSRLMRILNR